MNNYDSRLKALQEDTEKAKEYIVKYNSILRSDYKEQDRFKCYYDYVIYCLYYKLNLTFDRKHIIIFLIFRRHVFPTPLRLVLISISIQCILIPFLFFLTGGWLLVFYILVILVFVGTLAALLDYNWSNI